MRRRRGESDDGTITLLTLAFLAVGIGLVLTVVDISAVFLARRDLAGACDQAAVAAGQAVARPELYRGSTGRLLPLDLAAASRAASSAAGSAGAAASISRRQDGTLSLQCSRTVTLPLATGSVVGPVQVTAAADVETPLR